MTAAVAVGEVTSAGQLEALRPEWSDLWQRCPAGPFQSPEWLLPWWRHLSGPALCTLTLRRGGRLVGLVPLFRCIWGEPAARTVLLIGTGITDQLDALIDPDLGDGAAEAIFARLGGQRDQWDLCDFQQLPPGSALLGPAPAGWAEETTEQDACPVLALPPSVEDLGEAVPQHQLQNLRYYRKRAAKAGPVRVDSASEGHFEELFDAFLRLHGARWAARGHPGVLSDTAVRRFHRAAAEGMLRAGRLRLYGLRVGGRVVACYYGFQGKGRAYYYLGGFDPEHAALSLGTLLVGHAVEEAVREGAHEFDFLRGQERYKYLWGARDRPRYRRWLRPAGAEGGHA